jgi:GT2 family glycosyltransferase
MRMITASIVLYNTPDRQLQRLLGCLEHSAVQHLYIVDNSPDPTVVSTPSGLNITYIKATNNAGYGSGHNVALRKVLTRSKFHFVLNPDVHFLPEELDKMIEYMRMNENVGQLMPRVIYENGNLQYLCKLIPTPVDLLLRRFGGRFIQPLLRKRMERFELRLSGYNRVMDVPYLSGCFMLFRIAALCRVGLFDERFFMYPEDIDITRRVHAEFRTVFFPQATIVHDHAKESYKKGRFMRIHVQNVIKYFNKWGWVSDPERTQVNRETLRLLSLWRTNGGSSRE